MSRFRLWARALVAAGVIGAAAVTAIDSLVRMGWPEEDFHRVVAGVSDQTDARPCGRTHHWAFPYVRFEFTVPFWVDRGMRGISFEREGVEIDRARMRGGLNYELARYDGGTIGLYKRCGIVLCSLSMHFFIPDGPDGLDPPEAVAAADLADPATWTLVFKDGFGRELARRSFENATYPVPEITEAQPLEPFRGGFSDRVLWAEAEVDPATHSRFLLEYREQGRSWVRTHLLLDPGTEGTVRREVAVPVADPVGLRLQFVARDPVNHAERQQKIYLLDDDSGLPPCLPPIGSGGFG